MCESRGCCKWKAGTLYGGYCEAAKLGVCSRTDGPEPDTTKLSVASGINCKDLPSMGVSPWTAQAADAGFELRDCDKPTDVCGSYCVAIHEVRDVTVTRCRRGSVVLLEISLTTSAAYIYTRHPLPFLFRAAAAQQW